MRFRCPLCGRKLRQRVEIWVCDHCKKEWPARILRKMLDENPSLEVA